LTVPSAICHFLYSDWDERHPTPSATMAS